jgi:hypothetical protein
MEERKYQRRNNIYCSGCGEKKESSQRYCKKCHAKKMREQRVKAAEELKMLREFYKIHNGNG